MLLLSLRNIGRSLLELFIIVFQRFACHYKQINEPPDQADTEKAQNQFQCAVGSVTQHKSVNTELTHQERNQEHNHWVFKLQALYRVHLCIIERHQPWTDFLDAFLREKLTVCHQEPLHPLLHITGSAKGGRSHWLWLRLVLVLGLWLGLILWLLGWLCNRNRSDVCNRRNRAATSGTWCSTWRNLSTTFFTQHSFDNGGAAIWTRWSPVRHHLSTIFTFNQRHSSIISCEHRVGSRRCRFIEGQWCHIT